MPQDRNPIDAQRRRLLRGLVLAGAAGLSGCQREAGDGLSTGTGRQPRSSGTVGTMLILGGTGFVGPYVVRRALERGFGVTLFNRGRSSVDIFPDLELLVGDRNGDLASIRDQILAGRRWDAVIDLSGFTAVAVRDTAVLLAPATGHYVFMSSVAAYRSLGRVNDESSPLTTTWVNEYGPQKAQAEREATIAMDGRVSNIRPTIIAGPGDSRDRLVYWPARMARGGEMLVPGPPDRPVQFVDVRDVAAFTVRCAELKLEGSFNVVIPPGSYTMRQLVDDSRRLAGGTAETTWVTPEFIAGRGDIGENVLPLWDSPLGERRAFSLIEAPAAFAGGLTTRPPLDTMRDNFEWWLTQDADRRSRLRAGLDPAREAEWLSLWHEANA